MGTMASGVGARASYAEVGVNVQAAFHAVQGFTALLSLTQRPLFFKDGPRSSVEDHGHRYRPLPVCTIHPASLVELL